MSKKRYLTLDEVENLKDACATEEERSVVRDLTDTGMKLKDVLRERSKSVPDTYT